MNDNAKNLVWYAEQLNRIAQQYTNTNTNNQSTFINATIKKGIVRELKQLATNLNTIAKNITNETK